MFIPTGKECRRKLLKSKQKKKQPKGIFDPKKKQLNLKQQQQQLQQLQLQHNNKKMKKSYY